MKIAAVLRWTRDRTVWAFGHPDASAFRGAPVKPHASLPQRPARLAPSPWARPNPRAPTSTNGAGLPLRRRLRWRQWCRRPAV